MEMVPKNDRNDEEAKKKHERTKKVFKVLGPLFLALGIGGFILGAISMFSFETSLFPLMIVSPFLVFIGGTLSAFGYRREMSRYVSHETTPVINEAAKDIKPALSQFAQAVRSGSTCPHCGSPVDKDAKFCDQCGAALSQECPQCHEKNDADAQFCRNCGAKLKD